MTNISPFFTQEKQKCIDSCPAGSYFITITLNPKLYKMSIFDQWMVSKEYLKRKLKQWSSNFWLVGELTGQSNLHYHGWLSFDQPRYRHHVIDDLKGSSIAGMSKINESVIDNKDRTVNYMYKDIMNTSKYIMNPKIRFKAKPIPYVMTEERRQEINDLADRIIDNGQAGNMLDYLDGSINIIL